MTEQLLTEQELFLYTISHKRRLANFFKQHPNGLSALKALQAKLMELEGEVADHFKRLSEENAALEQSKAKVAEQVEALLSSNNLTKEQLFSTLNQSASQKDNSRRESNKKPLDISDYKYIYEHDGLTDVWKGSAGRKPQWVVRFQDAGIDIEQYRNPLYKGRP
ncbi:H-NS family nucleoid-associated regulatory protein [Aeromonas hydrophila]|uniref:H-NS family nucleoid-associated regulatory protein n=1 Tax=Aeromonas hydrophila TaxID=644 RepID=UPI002B45BC2A|nr:H-NS family nucleoid-associated regulatory protein [Aeromonas hydrophila]